MVHSGVQEVWGRYKVQRRWQVVTSAISWFVRGFWFGARLVCGDKGVKGRCVVVYLLSTTLFSYPRRKVHLRLLTSSHMD